MKRVLLSALVLASGSLGLVGCSDTSTDKVTSKVETPNGSVEKETTVKTTATGDQKPAEAH